MTSRYREERKERNIKTSISSKALTNYSHLLEAITEKRALKSKKEERKKEEIEEKGIGYETFCRLNASLQLQRKYSGKRRTTREY